MSAPPQQIWELVSDVTKIGRYSPETFEAEWLEGATGPAVGAKFRGHVKRNGKGPTYWTTCTVLTSEPGREFAFGVGPSDKPLNVWRYRLEPAGDGTDVTESWTELRPFPIPVIRSFMMNERRVKSLNAGCAKTLARIKAAAESSSS